jgi:NDP-sugar pyrophosphorylase family protein
MNAVAILAGGLGTRLLPITETIPKALVNVAGKPFIVQQLLYLKQQGISKVVICAGYLGEMIEAEVGNGDKFGISINYSFDGAHLLGTGGALKKALPMLGEQFFVLYGDSFLPINYLQIEDAFMNQEKLALMTVYKNFGRWDKSNVQFENQMILEYNKRTPNQSMNHIDYGLGLLKSSLFYNYPDNSPFDLADVYQQLSLDGQLMGFEVYERFYEIGSHQGLKDTNQYFMEISK